MHVATVLCGLVLAVLDGDSLRVQITPWPDVQVDTIVLMRGIDAPELRGQCAEEQAKAHAAREAVARHVAAAERVVCLTQIQRASQAGRVFAAVDAGGIDLGSWLLAHDLARAYTGGRRSSWCGQRLQ